MYTRSDYADINVSAITDISGRIMPTERRDGLLLALRKEDFAYLAQAAYDYCRDNVGSLSISTVPSFTRSYLSDIANALADSHEGLPYGATMTLIDIPSPSESEWFVPDLGGGPYQFDQFKEFLGSSNIWRNVKPIPSGSDFTDMTFYDSSKVIALYEFLFGAPYVSLAEYCICSSSTPGIPTTKFEIAGTWRKLSSGASTYYGDKSSFLGMSGVWELQNPTGVSSQFRADFIRTSGVYKLRWSGSLGTTFSLPFPQYNDNQTTRMFAAVYYSIDKGYGYYYRTKFKIVELTKSGSSWVMPPFLEADALRSMAESVSGEPWTDGLQLTDDQYNARSWKVVGVQAGIAGLWAANPKKYLIS